VRAPTVALSVVVTTLALAYGWHQGSTPSAGALPGVHVVSPPPTTSAGTGAAPGPGSRRAAGKRKKPASRRTLDGAVVATPYGTVQVQAVLVGTKITDVRALHLTDANGRSRQISAGAAPQLRREALAAQSAQIDTVSGATYTSQGYQTSLQAALDQAHR
jgi:uncharacterized protein with FMN-binding domain